MAKKSPGPAQDKPGLQWYADDKPRFVHMASPITAAVTPKMIEAGLRTLDRIICNEDVWLVERIYLAMESAK